MTALKQYQRLETPGIWRPAPEAQRRNVIVTFGDASLIITDQGDTPLAHWSLPALIRENPGSLPAVYRPGPDATETLEIEDTTLVEAIETIRNAVTKTRPRPGRLRLLISAGSVVALLAIGLFVLPAVLISHTAAVAPPPLRQEIGEQLLTRIDRIAGAACTTSGGDIALERLSRRLFGPDAPRIVILPAGLATTSHLPGNILLANRALVEDFEGPEAFAGYLLAENLRLTRIDPLKRLLKSTGANAAFRLLTTGQLPDDTLVEYTKDLMTRPLEEVDTDALIALFAKAELSSTPYAYAKDVSGEATLPLIEADPAPRSGDNLVLSDADWLRLQSICER